MYLTPDAKGGIVYRPLHIPDELVPHVSGALIELTNPARWEQFGDMTPQQCADMIAAMLVAYYRGNEMIGVIVPYANATIPDNLLPCDGSVHLAADYPDLYAALAPVYIDDETHFHTPDLVARFVMGTTINEGVTGGEEAHTLTVGEMPAHDHTDSGHTHSEITAISTVINGGLEAPAFAAVPGAGLTGAGTANILPTGGGGAHNNLPPYHALRWGIIWR